MYVRRAPVIALGLRQVAQRLRALVRLLISVGVEGVGVEVGRDHLGDLGLEPGDGPGVAPLHRSLHALQEALEGDVECEAVDSQRGGGPLVLRDVGGEAKLEGVLEAGLGFAAEVIALNKEGHCAQ